MILNEPKAPLARGLRSAWMSLSFYLPVGALLVSVVGFAAL